MSQFLGHLRFSHDQPLRDGVLLTNLGTPDAPERRNLRRYLKQFLWDPRVVELPRPLWWLILNLVILNLRPRRSAELYRKVWTEQGSPLMVHTRRLAEEVAAQLDERLPRPPLVEVAMRYGQPSIASALRRMHSAQLNRLMVLPMYPQYSGSTTGSTFDAVSRELRRWRWVPELRFVNGYHDNELYIEALAGKIRGAWETTDGPGQMLLMSFHGIPKRYLLEGDPYHCQCHATARLLAGKLGLPADRWKVVFQSRFGREPWLQPYCDETLAALPGQGVRSVDVVCPGFAVDCLETLEEIAIQNRELFERSGGESFRYIPCLNDDPANRDLVLNLIEQHTGGWRGFGADDDPAVLDERRDRALALGAER
ncbi:MAG: ferrochelatase [Gammaproteobacteria bacterium]|nr:ferrochelatase [Gammaproteobacteria bacterium]